METNRVGGEYRSDVAESVQLRIQQFYEEENRIAYLEAELHQLRRKHEDLRRELAPYHIAASSTTTVSHVGRPVDQEHQERSVPSIHRCPNEVLYLIFEPCVTPSHHHRFIRRLLLVCKRWHDIVINGAKLWTQIEVMSWDLFDFSTHTSQLSYISACMVHSKDVPMEVELNLTDFCGSGYIAEVLSRYSRTITDEEEHALIIRKIRNQEWDYYSPQFQKEKGLALDRLIEMSGRWGKLDIMLPIDGNEAMVVWNKIRKATSQLNLLRMGIVPGEWSILKALGNDRPNQLNVKSLVLGITTSGEAFSISLIDVSSDALRYLAVFADPSHNLADLSPYQQLRELQITCGYDEFDDSIELPNIALHLPHLHTLTIAKDYLILAQMRLEFPSLETLIIHVCYTHCKLPALSPRHITLSFNSQRTIVVDLNQVLYDFISLSSALQGMTVHGVGKVPVMKAVAQCKEEAKAVSLTQVIVGERNNALETIQV